MARGAMAVTGYAVFASLLALLAGAAPTPAAATTDAAPRAALDAFLRFETRGGRLEGGNWPTYVSRHIDAPPGYDEPGWDTVTALTGYRRLALACDRPTHCTARVRYTLAPTRALAVPGVVPHPRGGVETVTYTLVETPRGWRVRPDFGGPRVVASVLRARLAGQPTTPVAPFAVPDEATAVSRRNGAIPQAVS